MAEEIVSQRQRIMEASAKLFTTHGYRGISVREIAEAVGLSKAGLYYHFRDKEDLFLSILEESVEFVADIFRNAVNMSTNIQQKLFFVVEGLFALPERERAILRLGDQEKVHLSEAGRKRIIALHRDRTLQMIERMLDDAVRGGELRAIDINLTAGVFMGMCYPFICRWGEAEGQWLPNRSTAEFLVDVFLNGVAKS